MNYILFDSSAWNDLKPLTFTRPIAELRCGILTIREKWNLYLKTECSYKTQAYLQQKFPLHLQNNNVYINAQCLPNASLIAEIRALDINSVLMQNDTVIALACAGEYPENVDGFTHIQTKSECAQILFPWHIFLLNASEIEADFELLTKGRTSQALSETNRVIAPHNIFVEKGASVECATLNAQTGKMYIGENAQIMEGALIRGPFALCEHSSIKMGAKIYEGTTIGPHSKVGGEVQNSVIFGYSNKGHDGYLGNSVIGEWCNLGADTNNSNLKNDYSEVKVWNYTTQRFKKTGLQFCGLIMGDYSKSAINTMFNTGTVVGVSANVFGAGFPRNFTPSFSWGGPHGLDVYPLAKSVATAQRVFERREKIFSQVDNDILAYIFAETEQFRRF